MEDQKFPEPKEGSVFYEDNKTYACLAFEPKTDGHAIVAWKKNVKDLNNLNKKDYLSLMRIIYRVRKTLMNVYKAPKVYLAYLDESEHVHFHLFPRKKGEKGGFKLLCKKPKKLTDLSKISELVKSINK